MKIAKNIGNLIWGAILIGVGVIVFIVVINMFTGSSDDEGLISITEAQEKCIVMETYDSIRYNGEPASTAREKAEKHCLSLWDTPEKEKEFRKYMEEDWQTVKDEVYEGKTYEQYYNESVK